MVGFAILDRQAGVLLDSEAQTINDGREEEVKSVRGGHTEIEEALERVSHTYESITFGSLTKTYSL
jgi:hypothetical protein